MTDAGHTAGEWIARSDRTIAENGVPLLRFYAGRNEHQNAREAVASVNSYRRHFGPRAIEAAEADLLGKALEALRMVGSIRPANWDDGDDDEVIASFKAVDAILSQAQAPRGAVVMSEESKWALPQIKPEQSEQVFYVYREKGRRPEHRHPTYYHARKEAERLALLYPGARFHIISTHRIVEAPANPTQGRQG